jgi:hypothetical protein
MKKLTKVYKATDHFKLIQLLGTQALTDMFGITNVAVCNWRAAGAIPKDKLELIKYKRPKVYRAWLSQCEKDASTGE